MFILLGKKKKSCMHKEDEWSHDCLHHAEKNTSPSTLVGTLFQREKDRHADEKTEAASLHN